MCQRRRDKTNESSYLLLSSPLFSFFCFPLHMEGWMATTPMVLELLSSSSLFLESESEMLSDNDQTSSDQSFSNHDTLGTGIESLGKRFPTLSDFPEHPAVVILRTSTVHMYKYTSSKTILEGVESALFVLFYCDSLATHFATDF